MWEWRWKWTAAIWIFLLRFGIIHGWPYIWPHICVCLIPASLRLSTWWRLFKASDKSGDSVGSLISAMAKKRKKKNVWQGKLKKRRAKQSRGGGLKAKKGPAWRQTNWRTNENCWRWPDKR